MELRFEQPVAFQGNSIPPNGRREKEFSALTDDEVARIEEIYLDVFAGEKD